MNRILAIAAAGEALTGAALLAAPAFVGELLLGEPLVGVAAVAGRVAGLALIGLATACWRNAPLEGMLFYSGTVALYLAYLGIAQGFAGILLWPAVALHAALSILLWRTWANTGTGLMG